MRAPRALGPCSASRDRPWARHGSFLGRLWAKAWVVSGPGSDPLWGRANVRLADLPARNVKAPRHAKMHCRTANHEAPSASNHGSDAAALERKVDRRFPERVPQREQRGGSARRDVQPRLVCGSRRAVRQQCAQGALARTRERRVAIRVLQRRPLRPQHRRPAVPQHRAAQTFGEERKQRRCCAPGPITRRSSPREGGTAPRPHSDEPRYLRLTHFK